ncbi:TPA: DUF551 domain-containing protein [Klebsiella pneumoniae]|nr:DUF551 domain-containing protein [Klebsiella pneumoniae]
MTKSTITRERLQEMLEWCEVFRRHPRLDDISEAIRIALTAMDSEQGIPDEMTPEQAYEIGDYHGDPVDVFARGANWMRQHIINSTLAAATQSPGSEQATVPGKWILVSERMPDENAEQQVLACFKGGDISTLYYFEGRWDDAYGIVPIRQDVTHWMPLPAAPKEVKGE